jgi:tetratricopeptide (TPR) repeat protein
MKDGTPKLLDFGIAKLLDEDQAKVNDGLTKTGMWHLTPEYASPEQIKNESITTASDIYSLGVMLYQLLSGHQPYLFTTSSPVAISKIITEETIVKPSDKFMQPTEVTAEDGKTKKITPSDISAVRDEKPEKVYYHLKGDIDNIILKAMHKDPVRRYASVEQFSEDIRRHLVGVPVIARSDTIGYRLNKFIKRHTIGFVTSVVFVLFLIASVILISWQANVASEERDNASSEARNFERVNNYLLEMLSSVDPIELGRDVKVYDILEKAANDYKTELKYQPEIAAGISRTLGITYVNLGEYDVAKPHLYYALEVNEKLYGKESQQVATSLHDIGLLYHWLGDFKVTDSLYKKSLSIYRKVLSEPTQALADNLNNYATLYNEFGDFDKAENFLREALDINQKLNGNINREVAAAMNNLAITLHYKNNLEEAEKYYLGSQRIFIELFGEIHPDVGSTYNNLAFIYMDKTDFQTAEKYFVKSYEIKLSLKGVDHPDVGLALHNLASVQFKQQNYEAAETYFRKAITQFIKSLPKEHSWMGASKYWLARTLMDLNEFNKAEKQFRESLIIRKKVLPIDHPLIYLTEGDLGVCLLKQNKISEAEKLLLSSYDGSKSSAGMNRTDVKRFLESIIEIYEKRNEDNKVSDYRQILNNQFDN